MEKLIDIQSGPVVPLLDLLLKDKSTKKNIIWATDTYEELGHGFTDKEPISRSFLLQHADIIKPRIQKSQEAQQERTRKKAEVFTPAWLCNLMNNDCDEEWFGRKDVFNAENDDHTWTVAEESIAFPKRKTWKHYVDSRRLEITCGEAPYLVSRYDVSTGQLIVPPKRRIGQLDRKLRIVNENAADYDEWVKWAIRAFEASYGYEYQGDNLLIARINLLLTFIDYYQERWGKEPDEKLLQTVANKIVWNIWQMDGLKDTVPLGKPYEEFRQMTLFDMSSEMTDEELEAIPSKIYDWRRDNSIRFNKLKEMKAMGHKLFDFVIGNPPYNEAAPGDSTSDKPVYHIFFDEVSKVSDKVELVTPGRFLFNAGATPKEWNKKMLSSKHVKVLEYEENASRYFGNTAITGGVAVTYIDNTREFKPIDIFVPYDELKNIILKAKAYKGFESLSSIISGRTPYLFTDKMHEDFPEAILMLSKGHASDISSNAFTALPNIFLQVCPSDENKYYRVLGRLNNKRAYFWIRREYARGRLDEYIGTWKVFLPKANGASGMLGKEAARLISKPVVGSPEEIATDTFIVVGHYDNQYEAESVLKYLNSKFSRALLGALKVTQINSKETWEYVPLQDFTSTSDIDWSKSVHEIDLQLYRKYGLDEKEINFIESHVKEMA
ncbi:MAG: Eco57I restriction-modification methylase domain-containing protein [Clostridiales bacterium]|nr:Eco57I restriction-modification methylase domain-containing protein [Clostridiales bacterium]